MSRATLIHLLQYPRRFVSAQVLSEPCDHGWNHAESQPDCEHCWHNLACSWLTHNDDSVDLESRSIAQLMEALELALGQVDAHLVSNGHDRRRCHCDTCAWYRQAQRCFVEISDAS